MDVCSYHVPLLGQSFFMFVDAVRFHVSDGKSLSFYNDRKNEPLKCPLFTRHAHHKKVITFLEESTTHLHIEKKSKRQHMLSVDKHMDNLRFVASMIKTLFDNENVYVEVCVNADDNYMGRCEFHLLDLYEMGYATHTPALVARPAAFARHDPHVYTGFLLHANNPLQHFPEDYVHLELSCVNQHNFFLLSLENMASHRPDIVAALTPVIGNLIRSIPLHSRKSHAAFLQDWEDYHWVEVRPHHLAIPIRQWTPGRFLHHFARILDLFHAYTLTRRFSLGMTL